MVVVGDIVCDVGSLTHCDKIAASLNGIFGKLFNKVLNYRLLCWLEEHNKLSESQAGFRFGRSCVENLFFLNEVIQGRLQEGKKKFHFSLIKKAYDTVWRDGLWYRINNVGDGNTR